MRSFVAALVGYCLATCLLKAALEANLHRKKADDGTETHQTHFQCAGSNQHMLDLLIVIKRLSEEEQG